MLLTETQALEIALLREKNHSTRRPTVPELEALLFKPLPVLDHGFVRLVDYMGDDAAIVQAARVSYGRGTKKISEDRGLIHYLMRHRHSTPFEMAELKLHIKLPIFVARQWIRHRTANVNEYSARYSILDKEFYIPSPEHLAMQSSANRQGRGELLNTDKAARVLEILKSDSEKAYQHYTQLLAEGGEDSLLDTTEQKPLGLARELARINLPLNYYTQWYWKVDLHNLLHFLALRSSEQAQYEIRAYADLILNTIVKKWVPETYLAFLEHRLQAVHLSASSLSVIKRLVKGESITQTTSGLSPRAWRELMTLLEL